MLRRLWTLLAAGALVVPLAAQSRLDADINAQIRQEENAHSKIMHTLHMLMHTHHTNLDTYERIIEADVRDASVIVAATLYQLAMRDEPLPRFAADKMPAPPQRGGSGQ
jgi:hypothetical protein